MYSFLRKTLTTAVVSGTTLFGVGVALCLPMNAIAQPADPGEPADAETLAKATEILRAVGKAYRVDNLTDEVTAYVKDPLWSERYVEFVIRMGENATAQVELERMVATCVDDMVYVIDHRVPHRYASMPLDGDLARTLTDPASGQKFNLPHFALRRATNDAELAEAVTRYINGADLVGYETRENEEGASRHVLKFKGDEGHQEVFVDPDTFFIEFVDIHAKPKDTGGNFHIKLSLDTTHHPDGLPKPIEFTPGDREAVATTAELEVREPQVGDRAADLVAQNLDGNRVRVPLGDGKLHVVVFWSSENSACERMMVKINHLAQWAELDKLPIRVTGVNVAENVFDAERLELVNAYWETGGYDFDTYIDRSDVLNAAYAVRFLPQTVVIDREGKLRKVFYGPDERLDEKVRLVLEEVMREPVGGTGG